VVEQLERFPVRNGLAIYNGPPLVDRFLRWAIALHDYASSSAVFRSGPLRRLPGPPSNTRPTGRVSVFICGKSNLQLPEIGPHFVAERLASLPAPLQFVVVELGSDDDGHYTVTVRGRLETASRVLPFTYQRALRVVGSLDPGRPERVVDARAEGAAKIRGANVRPYAAELDAAITMAVEALFGAATLTIAQLCLELAGRPFQATTISVGAISFLEFHSDPTDPNPATEGYTALAAGAITGAVLEPAPAATIS
jgi:hypothetical protein